MYSVYKLNKQGDKIQPWHIPFPISLQFRLLLPDLHTGFSGGRWGGLGFPSLSEFPSLLYSIHNKGFSIVSGAEVDVFWNCRDFPMNPLGCALSLSRICLWPHAARQAPLSLGIVQARILEWVAMPSSKGWSQPRDWTQVSHIAGKLFLISEPPGKTKNTGVGSLSLHQGIFPTQGSNWSLLHCRWILYQLSCQESPWPPPSI